MVVRLLGWRMDSDWKEVTDSIPHRVSCCMGDADGDGSRRRQQQLQRGPKQLVD
jgi:hypothetical protein